VDGKRSDGDAYFKPGSTHRFPNLGAKGLFVFNVDPLSPSNAPTKIAPRNDGSRRHAAAKNA